MPGKLRERYYRELFRPSWLGPFVNPWFLARRGLCRAVQGHARRMQGRLLDFGCGCRPYRDLFPATEQVGLEIEGAVQGPHNADVDAFYDGHTIPFPAADFDSVFSGEVFEHIFNLPEILGELHRVLKPGGHLLITIPFAWPEHMVPRDFARYTRYGIRSLLEDAGFEVLDTVPTTTDVETIIQLWNTYVAEVLFPVNVYARVLMTSLLLSVSALAGLVLGVLLRPSGNLYQNSVVLARKPGSRTGELSL